MRNQALFDTLSSGRENETTSLVLVRSIFTLWCLIGLSGLIVTFLKQGGMRILPRFSYGAVFLLALFFLVSSIKNSRPPRTRTTGLQALILLFLAMVPTWIHMLAQ